MPIPGSILSNMILDTASFQAQVDPNVFPSTCTFYSKSVVSSSTGQQKSIFTQMDVAHTNVPCRKSPLIQIRPQNQVMQAGEFQRVDARYQLNLDRHFSDVAVEYFVTVDGVSHRIVAVEGDGNNITSRFMLSDEVPFNA